MSEIREPVTHNLKILPENYSAVCAGVKRAELRKMTAITAPVTLSTFASGIRMTSLLQVITSA